MLEDVRVLDLSRLLPGPACTWFLRGMGAHVDRVEPMGAGDYSRLFPPFIDGVGAMYAAVSRGKRSLSMEMRHSGAADLIVRLAPHYDVVVEGFKPGVLEAIGVQPDELVKLGNGLILARLSGFGQTGPWSQRPGHDLNYIGLAGVVAGMGNGAHGPVTPVFQLADMAGGMTAAMGIVAALYQRKTTGKGRVLDISLTESAMSVLAPHVTAWTAEKRDPLPNGEMLSGAMAVYGTYECADGKWLTVGALEPKFQARLAKRAGGVERQDLVALFLSENRDFWVAELSDACVAPALLPSELSEHPQHRARGAVEEFAGAHWVKPPFSSLGGQGRVPGLGEHTDQILIEAGFSSSECAAFRAEGLVQ